MEKSRLYVLRKNDEIISAFALCNSNAGSDCIKWHSENARALYIDRFGVNVNYLRKGIGSIVLNKAIALARGLGAEYLRLFVVDINEPAIKLYIKNGFEKVDGIYDEIIDENLILHEFGFKIKTF
ncbi:GNAT family N-acetyltransferase [Lacrimispora sp.]|uniref:GNAT family N-acetyltransferase n=1 Tax=Lacrimispora sp. TaxID=2719234 RepID=UPI0034606552